LYQIEANDGILFKAKSGICKKCNDMVMFLKKGENVFYLNGKDQTFPYRMILKVTFFEPEKIDSVILYPIEK